MSGAGSQDHLEGSSRITGTTSPAGWTWVSYELDRLPGRHLPEDSRDSTVRRPQRTLPTRESHMPWVTQADRAGTEVID